MADADDESRTAAGVWAGGDEERNMPCDKTEIRKSRSRLKPKVQILSLTS